MATEAIRASVQLLANKHEKIRRRKEKKKIKNKKRKKKIKKKKEKEEDKRQLC